MTEREPYKILKPDDAQVALVDITGPEMGENGLAEGGRPADLRPG